MKLKEPYTRLPVKPPLLPMLSTPEENVPRGDEWIYEPKWDGFRAIVFKSGEHVHIGSRNTRPLERYFPELVQAFREALPEKVVLDGEIVIATENGLDFGLLQLRLHPAESRVRKLSTETPASFVAFDLVGIDDEDLRRVAFSERRARLEKTLAARPHPRIQVTPQTRDPNEAEKWVTGNTSDGLDGVVAKKASLLYVPGERVMVKVKPRRTADCVVGGFREHAKGQGVGSLLLGLYDDEGVLRHVGFTSGFSAKDRKAIRAMLEPLAGKPSFGGEYAPGGPSRWNQGEERPWVSVEPKLVCEVQFDRLVAGTFRHATAFLRWRPDKDPKECRFDQF